MEFETTTVEIILNEMFKDYLKIENGTDFEKLKHDYAERIVKLFVIPDVSKSVYVKCGCGGNLIPTEDGLVCDICG